MVPVFGKGLDIPRLKHTIAVLNDILYQALPEVKRVKRLLVFVLCALPCC